VEEAEVEVEEEEEVVAEVAVEGAGAGAGDRGGPCGRQHHQERSSSSLNLP